ncbi:MAG: EutN/CcmL family microcompartment protein [Planctomycetota bacterium]
MILATVTGNLFGTRKNARFDGNKILVVREETPDGDARGPTFLALDRVDAGVGDRVLVNKEGSGARLLFGDERIPVQAVIVAVVDGIDSQEGGE